jgi:hypothetical protein
MNHMIARIGSSGDFRPKDGVRPEAEIAKELRI